MSRAFVKEDSDAPPPPPPERPVSSAPNRVTPRGAMLIRQHVGALEHAIAAAPDPAVLPALRRDLRYWQSRQASMQIVEPAADATSAGFGTTVTFERAGATRTLTIVGEDEADPAAGLIAWTAPLARALDGAEAGDRVEIDTAGRSDTILVVAVASGT